MSPTATSTVLHRTIIGMIALSPSRAGADVQGAAIDSSFRSPIMNLMEDQQAPQSAEGEAKVITLCG